MSKLDEIVKAMPSMRERLRAKERRIGWHPPEMGRFFNQLALRYQKPIEELLAMYRALLQQNDIEVNRVWLAEPPAPESEINLLLAHNQSRDDLRECERLMAAAPDLETLQAIYQNITGWMVFWSERHQSEMMREAFRLALEHPTIAKDWLERRQT